MQDPPRAIKRADPAESWERTLAVEEELARRIGNSPTLSGLIGHYSYAEHPEDLSAESINVAVLPEQRSYVALRVRGISSGTASAHLNINRLAAQRWEQSDWFERVSEEERKKWLTDAGLSQKQEAFIPLYNDALQAVKDTLYCEDPKIKLAAAQFVMDNLFGQEKRPVGRPRNLNNENVTPDLTDIMATAIKRINEARDGILGDSVTIVASPDYASPNGVHNKPESD
jgi:hypothetical protein